MTWLLKKPSAWVPILLSLGIIAMIIGVISIEGIVQHEDEGTPAHIFQLWLAIEFFLLAYFAAVWFSKMPRETLQILALQLLVAVAAAAPIFIFQL